MLFSKQLQNGSQDFLHIFNTIFLDYLMKNPQTTNDLIFLTHIILAIVITVIQNPRSRSLIQKWSSYKKYFFYALGSSIIYFDN